MPILEAVAPDEPLGQGDLLKGLEFQFSTLLGTGPKKQNDYHLGLVISRDCVVMNKRSISVVPVRKLDQNPFAEIQNTAARSKDGKPTVSHEEIFEDLMTALETLRDGDGGEPDRFYLGNPDDRGDRLIALLESATPFILPTDKEQLKLWVAEHRIARLSADFQKALAVRHYLTIARVGFEDDSWFADLDLETVVNSGKAAISELELAVDSINLNRNLKGGETEANQRTEQPRAGKEYDAKKARVDAMHKRVAPLVEELERRKKAAGIGDTFQQEMSRKDAARLSPQGNAAARPQRLSPDPPGIGVSAETAAAEVKPADAATKPQG